MLSSARLLLHPLTPSQLVLCLSDRQALAAELNLPIAEGILTGNAARAVSRKLAKMAKVEASLHDWYTYWLIIIKAGPVGAGLIGFKGHPDAAGKTEVGYGIAEAYQNRGYMTEALRALSDWAFQNPDCRVLTATRVVNPASARVLAKLGWRRVRAGEQSSEWELHRDACQDKEVE